MSNQTVQDQTSYPAVVGHVLFEGRKQRNMEQADVGSALGLSQSSWSRIERGDSALSVEQLAKVAKLFGEPPSQILRQADEIADALKAMNVAVMPERPDKTTNTAFAFVCGAVLAFLVAKALAK